MSPAPPHDKNVYIIGAGFSASAGVPLVHDFLQAAREHHRNPAVSLSASLRNHYDEVFRFRSEIRRALDSVTLPLENIEALFSMVEMSVLLSRTPASLMESIKHVIADTIERRQGAGIRMRVGVDASTLDDFPDLGPLVSRFEKDASRSPNAPLGNPTIVQRFIEMGEYDFAVALLCGIFDRPGTQNSFISFNYDLVVEDAFRNLGLVPDYGTTGLRWNGGQPTGRSVPLLKLHGSINWADLHATAPNPVPFVYRKYGDFGTNHPPILVPPTWNKGNFHAVIKDVWARAHDELVDATRIVVIGYSMPVTDTHFTYLVATALANNQGLYNAGLVDLDSPQLWQRYSGLFQPLLQYGKFESLGGEGGLQGFLLGDKARRIGRGKAVINTYLGR